MITHRSDEAMAHKVFSISKQTREQTVYCPLGIYAAIFTVESYLAESKVDFQIELVLPFLKIIEIDDISVKLSSLSKDKQRLIHILSRLMIDKPKIYIELPKDELSEQNLALICKLIYAYKPLKEEIAIVTTNNQTMNFINNYTLDSKLPTPVHFRLKPSPIKSQIYHFTFSKVTIATSLILVFFLCAYTMYIDHNLYSNETIDTFIPNDMIILDNAHINCGFNSITYSAANSECANAKLYTYSDFPLFLQTPGIQNIYFEDIAHNARTASEAEKQITTNDLPASITQLSDFLYNIGCIDKGASLQNMGCSNYSTHNAVIAAANADDYSAWTRNLKNNSESSPGFIVIETSDSQNAANYLANLNPNIKVLTNESINTYQNSATKWFLIMNLIASILLIAFTIFIIHLGFSCFRISIADYAYHLRYLSLDSKRANFGFYLSQLIVYIENISLTVALSIELTVSIYSQYFALILIVLLTIFSLIASEKTTSLN